MENFTAGLLKMEARENEIPGPIQILWTGRSTDRNPGKLFGPYLSGAIALAAARKVAIEMHFERLEYFNSSTISAILALINEAQRHKVKMIMTFDPSLGWQAMNFATMNQIFAGNEYLELRPLPR